MRPGASLKICVVGKDTVVPPNEMRQEVFSFRATDEGVCLLGFGSEACFTFERVAEEKQTCFFQETG